MDLTQRQFSNHHLLRYNPRTQFMHNFMSLNQFKNLYEYVQKIGVFKFRQTAADLCSWISSDIAEPMAILQISRIENRPHNKTKRIKKENGTEKIFAWIWRGSSHILARTVTSFENRRTPSITWPPRMWANDSRITRINYINIKQSVLRWISGLPRAISLNWRNWFYAAGPQFC